MRIHILCFGNILHGDDGFGEAVYQQLQQRSLPENVTVFNVGTRSLHALNLFEQCDITILIDAEANQGQAGHVRVIADPDPPTLANPNTLHEAGLTWLLQALPVAIPHPPRVFLLTTQIQQIKAFQPQLSPPVADAVPVAVQQIQQLLEVLAA